MMTDHSSPAGIVSPLTFATSTGDAEKVKTRRAVIGASIPVFGLRPTRARLQRTLNAQRSAVSPVRRERAPRRSPQKSPPEFSPPVGAKALYSCDKLPPAKRRASRRPRSCSAPSCSTPPQSRQDRSPTFKLAIPRTAHSACTVSQCMPLTRLACFLAPPSRPFRAKAPSARVRAKTPLPSPWRSARADSRRRF